MKLIAFIYLILIFHSIVAQENAKSELQVKGIENTTVEYPNFVSDSLMAVHEADNILQQLYAQSFLAARLDSIKTHSNLLTLYFYEGDKYKWLNLRTGNLPPSVVSKVDLNSRLFFNRPFKQTQLVQLLERTITYYENNGYPFVSVKLDSVKINEQNKISAALQVQKGKYYQFDSLEVIGDLRVSEQYILHRLNLKLEQAYNEEKMQQISLRIREIPFLTEERKHEVQFFDEFVKLKLYLRKKQASNFNGIIGLMTNENDGSIELTGDVDLHLVNAFNQGSEMGLKWQKIKGNAQELKINFGMPYLFNTAFGIDFDFQLYKEDTTFLNLKSRIGTNYAFNGEEQIQLFIENRQSSLLSTNQYLNNTTLPPFADIKTNQVGLSYSKSKLNYRYNPRKGFVVQPTFAVGRKKVEKIAVLEENQPNIYDGIEENSIQFDGQLKLQLYLPIGQRSTVFIGNQSASTYANTLYTNELLRIGGLKTLRGFDEGAIRVSSYSIFTLEYRFLLDRNSFLAIFSDGAWYEANDINGYIHDKPFGIGAGINFETVAGIFSFNYAIGKQFNNPIEFRAAKIHFGFTSIF